MDFPFLSERSNDLNPEQLRAVASTEGPLLVLAGAGSGKTRVLTYRIAHLIRDIDVPISQILAMTFSNKAAREMHDRIKALLGDASPYRYPWISTFHSVGARLLRIYGERLGYKNEFAIYDTGEQLGIVKSIFDAKGLSDKAISPDAALTRIGDWKNDAKTPEQAAEVSMSSFDNQCAEIYSLYSAEMKKAQAMDFDDLLLLSYRLFKDNEDVQNYFRSQWRYVLIDEFQDTNTIQYKLLRELLNPERNICVVGDDDQSIYGWRGAKVDNILNFDREFEGCQVIKLEQNYRSTGNILKAADQIISKNELRHKKTLWTSAGEGQRIHLAALEDDRSESNFVVSEIKKLKASGTSANQIAVLYRINSLSRGFEEECLRQRVDYKIIGGFRFYERKEIKDILSYFKLILNPSDLMAFRRTINTPLRGIGKTSVEKIEVQANSSELPIADWVRATDIPPVSGKAREGYLNYRDFLVWGAGAIEGSDSLVDLFIDGIKKTRYMEILEKEKTPESQDRLENIQELLAAVQEFEETYTPSEDLPSTGSLVRQKLRDFLERVSLIADVDQLDGVGNEQVTFMSLHSAKGLEFDICFMAGMEEGLFPSSRSFDSYQRTEEERRLCYVGITRARKRLYMTRANRRRTFGSINFSLPSRFLNDLPKNILETVKEEAVYEQAFEYYRPKKFAGGSSAGGSRTQQDWDASSFDFEFDQRTDTDSSAFHKGDRVNHPSFGEGIVQKSEFLGADECLSIVFSGRGLKKVLARFVSKKG